MPRSHCGRAPAMGDTVVAISGKYSLTQPPSGHSGSRPSRTQNALSVKPSPGAASITGWAQRQVQVVIPITSAADAVLGRGALVLCPGVVLWACWLCPLSHTSFFLRKQFQLSGFLILLPSSQRLRVQKLLFHFIPFSPKPNSFKNLGAAYMLIQNPLHGNKNLTHIMFSF